MFSSRPPFNDDPHPWVWSRHSPRNKARVDTDMFRAGANGRMANYEHAPRPEYDRPQNNPTNPILVEFRRAAHNYTKAGLERYHAVQHYLQYLDGDVYGWSEEHKDHARRVLSRLEHPIGALRVVGMGPRERECQVWHFEPGGKGEDAFMDTLDSLELRGWSYWPYEMTAQGWTDL